MEKFELEDQFILRLPHCEAEYVREVLRTKPTRIKKLLKLELDPKTGHSVVIINNKQLTARLRKLPTISESMKTYNKSVFVKTADICHILDCVDLEGPIEMQHGLTPPLKNVRQKRFRKCLINKDEDAINIQKELYYLLQADLAAVSTRFEFIYLDDNQNGTNTVNQNRLVHSTTVGGNCKNSNKSEIEIFGNVLTDSEEETDSNIEEVE